MATVNSRHRTSAERITTTQIERAHVHCAKTNQIHTDTEKNTHTHTQLHQPSKTVFIKTQRTVEEYRCVENKTTTKKNKVISFFFYFVFTQ